MPEIFPHTRLRRSPYYEATMAEGVAVFNPYNKMLLPLGYGDPEGEYRRLVDTVSMWDVGGQRQVQMHGPDAARLTQMLCTRDLSTCEVGQGKYVALCNHVGTIINDPVMLKVAEDTFWLSVADSDIGLWASCVAAERGLDVEISEPDVSPLAVQGPFATQVVSSIVGDWVSELRPFWFRDVEVEGIPFKLARSGWSKQGGFELYLTDGTKGIELWNLVKDAGEPWGIGAGSPNPAERIESGLLSWGGDTDDHTNPFEVRLSRFVDLDVPDEVIGIDALRRVAAEGPKRHQLGVVLSGDDQLPGHETWFDIVSDGAKVGDMTNGTWSYKLERMIGFGLVSVNSHVGDLVQVHKDGSVVDAKLVEIPFREEDR